MSSAISMKEKDAPYEVRRNVELGRYLVAARDLEPLTLVIEEGPTVCGTADDDQDMDLGDIPMCLGCFSRMTVCSSASCSRCGWPVCDRQCEQMPVHAENECAHFVDKNVTYPPPHTWPIINKSILVLRCLILKERKSLEWEEVLQPLEHHTEARHKKSYCLKGDEMLLNNLQYFGFLHEDDQSLKILIVEMSGKLNVNAFSTSQPSTIQPNQTMIAQCVFPQASLLAHSCVPNSTWRIGPSPSLRITIRTSVPIRKGQMITIAYSSHDNIYGTLQRQISNEDVAHFICSCPRCKDPTELGTFVSGVKCPSCETGFLLPLHPLNPDSVWECQPEQGQIETSILCNETQTVQKIVRMVYLIRRKYEEIINAKQHSMMQEELEELESLIESNAGSILHPNHYVLQEVRMHIVKRLVRHPGQLRQKHVERLIKHAGLLLSIANILSPGFSQLRSLLQHFLAQGLLSKMQSEWFTPSDEEEDQDIHRLIYSLQSRALLFFKNHNSSTCRQNQHLVWSLQRNLEDMYKSDKKVK